MKALPLVLLAGGLATRLRPLTTTLPKSLIVIQGEPFIAHQLRLLAERGIRQVVMCLGYLGDQIIEYVGNGSRFGLEIMYHFDGERLLGTAGAIKQALAHLADNFFVMNGDSYLPCDYLAIQSAFLQAQQPGLMTVFHNQNRWDTSNVLFSKGQVMLYDKNNPSSAMAHIDYGLSLFNKAAFRNVLSGAVVDLAVVYQDLIASKALAGYEVTERFYENGSQLGIQELENYFSQTQPISA